MIRKISSLQNPVIKNIVLLGEKARERRIQDLFVIEGRREITLAIKGGFEISASFFCPEILAPESALMILGSERSSELTEVTPEVYHRISYRSNAEGIIALAKPKYLRPYELSLPENPLVLVLESVEKPGNLGAVLRTADAAGIHAVVICDPQTDIYNPNSVRSSIGCIFTVPLAVGSSDETCDWMKSKGIRSFAASLGSEIYYHDCDFRGPAAFIMGTESTGLSQFWLDNADLHIKIPMLGRIDSMNVSVSAAVLVFEAMRQRNFQT